MRSIWIPCLAAFAIGCERASEPAPAKPVVSAPASAAAVGAGSAVAEPTSRAPAHEAASVTPRVLLMEPDLGTSPGRLPRELARQALLAVAREEFDVVVRDGALGEVAPTDVPAAEVIDLLPQLTANPANGAARLSADLKPHTQRDWLMNQPEFAASYTTGVPPAFNYPWKAGTPLAGLEEMVSTTVEAAEGFDAFLREHGVSARASSDAEPGPAPDISEIHLRLREMSVVPQFEAVRAAHALPTGPEKERLLAIGYSNLGLLTQHLWSPASKVFAARGLVYADRADRAESGPDADEVRAYAAALTGLHAAALKYADAAGVDRSPRLKAVVSFCRFRHDELLKLSEESPEVRELAAVLACLAVEPTGRGEPLAETYGALTEASPDAFRAYDPTASSREIGLLHDVTVRGPSQLARSVPVRLRAVKGLPPAVTEILAGDAVMPAELADRLEAQTASGEDPSEPSWPMLGRVLRDESLIQAYRRLRFLREALGVPTDAEYAGFRTFVGKHRYAEIVLGPFAGAPDSEKFLTAAEALPVDPANPEYWRSSSELGPGHWPLTGFLRSAGLVPQGQKYFERMVTNADRTRDDLRKVIDAQLTLLLEMESGLDPLDSLAVISPHDAYRTIRLLRRKGELPPERLAAIEKEFQDRPEVLAHLSMELAHAGKPADALRVSERAAEVAPAFDTFYLLALSRQGAGDEAGYLKTLEEALQYPSYGLGASDVRIRLATYHMRRGDYETAEPYAAEAAEAYSARSLVCAVDCYTGLGDWEAAEGWARRAGERYGTLSAMWYFWCRRTGRGDEAAAKAAADAFYASYERPPGEQTASNTIGLAYYRLIEGRDREAGDLREALAREEKNPAGALVASVALVRAGERDRAIALLGEAESWTTASPKAPNAARRAGIFHDALVAGRPLAPEVTRELADAIDTFAEWERVGFRAYYGELMIRLGNREEGMKLLRMAAEAVPDYIDHQKSENFDLHSRTYAAIWLREHLAEEKGGKEPQPLEAVDDRPDA